MARLDITPASDMGEYPTVPLAAGSRDFVFVEPGTFSDGISFTNTGREVLIVSSDGSKTVTISSSAFLGRTGDITAYAMTIGEFAWFGPFTKKGGWDQIGLGKVYAVGSAAGIKFAVLRLPPVVE